MWQSVARLSPGSIFIYHDYSNHKGSARSFKMANNQYNARHIQQFLTYQSPIVPTSEVDMMRAHPWNWLH
jgi:hypothetical protein